MSKIFIIGLPRTGTTSVCVSLLDLGFKVAHCAVTEGSLLAADVIGDTPAYCDYRKLDRRFPGSRFIYLERQIDSWLPSIKSLFENMITGLLMPQGGFPPAVKRCYAETFSPLNRQTAISDEHLKNCYIRHRDNVSEYFKNRPNDIISIDVSHQNAYLKMIDFLNVQSDRDSFKKMNASGKIVSWRELQHKNKIRLNLPSTNGEIELYR